MKTVCEEFSAATWDGAAWRLANGTPVASQLVTIGAAFKALQLARHDADYALAIPLTHADADFHVMTAENAFMDWTACQADPSAAVFLTELFVQCAVKRS